MSRGLRNDFEKALGNSWAAPQSSLLYHCIVLQLDIFIIPNISSSYEGTCIQILLPKILPTVRFLQFWPEAPMFWCYPHVRWDKNSRVMYPMMKEQRHRRLSFVIEWGTEESSFPKWPTSSQVTSGPPQESTQAACYIYIGVHTVNMIKVKRSRSGQT